MPDTSQVTDAKSHPHTQLHRHPGWEPLSTLRAEIDSLFDAFGPIGWAGRSQVPDEGPDDQRPFMPSIDLSETDDAYELVMDLPGMKLDDIQVDLSNDVLTVSGEMRRSVLDKDKTYLRIERHCGSFHRAFYMPGDADEDAVTAEFTNGVLKVLIPKSETARRAEKKIDIKSG